MTPGRTIAVAGLIFVALLGVALTANSCGYGWGTRHDRHLNPRPTGGWVTPSQRGATP